MPKTPSTDKELTDRLGLSFGHAADASVFLANEREARAFNRRMLAATLDSGSNRDRLVLRFQRELDAILVDDVANIMRGLERSGGLDKLADDSAAIYTSVRRSGDPEHETHRALLKQLRKSPNVNEMILAELEIAAELMNVDFENAVDTIHVGQFLFYEAGALVVQDALRDPKSVITLRRISTAKAVDGGFNIDDYTIVDSGILEQQFPQVGEAIAARANEITAVRFSNPMFDTLRDTFKHELFERAGGGSGARVLARKIAKDLAGKYKSKLPDITKKRYMLWARTEGAVMQNDGLMKLSADVGMEGKVWQTVGDNRVRPGHIQNEADGIIPVGDTFSDGSTDAGSGSVSPYACRCVSGGALLTKKGPKTSGGTAKPKPTTSLLPPVPKKKPKVKPKAKPKAKPKPPKAETPVGHKTETPFNANQVRTKHALEKDLATRDAITGESNRLKAIVDSGITDAERVAAKSYREGGYTLMNQVARDIPVPTTISPEVIAGAKAKNEALAKLISKHRTDRDYMMHRGIRVNPFDKSNEAGALRAMIRDAEQGNLAHRVVKDSGFTSLSLDKKIGKKFADSAVQDMDSIVIKAYVPKGSSFTVGTAHESEVILQRGGSYYIHETAVIQKRNGPGKVLEMFIEFLPSPGKLKIVPPVKLRPRKLPPPPKVGTPVGYRTNTKFQRNQIDTQHNLEKPFSEGALIDDRNITLIEQQRLESAGVGIGTKAEDAARRRYRDVDYDVMNNVARGTQPKINYSDADLRRAAEHNDRLSSLIAKQKTDQDYMLHRGLHANVKDNADSAKFIRAMFDEAEEGRLVHRTVIDPGFESVTLSKQIRDVFAKTDVGFHDSVLIKMYVPKGTGFTTGVKFERELILQRGNAYYIHEVEVIQKANGPGRILKMFVELLP